MKVYAVISGKIVRAAVMAVATCFLASSSMAVDEKIVIGADHRGFPLKQFILSAYHPVEWIDVGTDTDVIRSDYPFFAHKVCSLIQSGEVNKGILICSTGVGMAIAANRFSRIYAAVAWNKDIARLSVEHGNANLLIIPTDYVSAQLALEIIDAWLSAKFLGGRYRERIAMVDALGGVIDAQNG